MIDMNYDDVKYKLLLIIHDYIDDEVLRENLVAQAQNSQTIRGVLYTLSENKNKNLTDEDMKFCQDLFFYFG